jgi:hypothetical protein
MKSSNPLRQVLYLCVFASASTDVKAQEFENIIASVHGDSIEIAYDLKNLPAESSVNIKVFSSHNAFTSPLQNLYGDLKLVKNGLGKKIIWNAADLRGYTGELTFQLDGEIIHAWKFKTKSKFRRGKQLVIKWTGGSEEDKIRTELLDPSGNQIFATECENKKSHSWTLPKSLKPDRGYSLRISVADHTVENKSVRISRRIARLWIITPILMAATVFYMIQPADQTLPQAPSTPEGN